MIGTPLAAIAPVTVIRMAREDDANRLGDYLRARRELVTPQQVGLPAGSHRRVPGLRREEVALLAGISADYYMRLERGRDKNPSLQVLEALGRVLQLDDVETQYLSELSADRPRKRPRRRTERVPPRLHHLLTAIGVPAFVEGRYYDVLASNSLAVAFSPRLRLGQNRMRSMFLDPAERDFQHHWETAAGQFVAMFRQSVGDAIDDPRAVELVGELTLASGRFRSLWSRHDVRQLEGGTATFNHPVVGEMQLYRDKLPVDDVILVVYYPEQGSAGAEKLALLASLAATSPEPAADELRAPAEPAPEPSTES